MCDSEKPGSEHPTLTARLTGLERLITSVFCADTWAAISSPSHKWRRDGSCIRSLFTYISGPVVGQRNWSMPHFQDYSVAAMFLGIAAASSLLRLWRGLLRFKKQNKPVESQNQVMSFLNTFKMLCWILISITGSLYFPQYHRTGDKFNHCFEGLKWYDLRHFTQS